MIDKKIGIIGCGNMGEALFSRLADVVEKSTELMVSEFDAGRRDYIKSKYHIIVEIDNNKVVKFADVVILAVKPKDFDQLLRQEVCCGASGKKLFISIAAGITTKYIEKVVGSDVPVIRAMPNMGALAGKAVTSLSAGQAALADSMRIARAIFSLMGEVVEVDEKYVDAVTAVSGSGPAYFYYLMQALLEAARDAGFDNETAGKLVMGTAAGSIAVMDKLKEDPVKLIERIASKGGTTEAALKVFESKKLKRIVGQAVKAAEKRSKELSKE